jgi:hypothetical protein
VQLMAVPYGAKDLNLTHMHCDLRWGLRAVRGSKHMVIYCTHDTPVHSSMTAAAATASSQACREPPYGAKQWPHSACIQTGQAVPPRVSCTCPLQWPRKCSALRADHR